MLNHREKRRYIAIMYEEQSAYSPLQLHGKIGNRFKELFGIFPMRLARLKLYDSEFRNVMFVGCSLKYLDYFLVSMVLGEPSLIAISISGTLKRLRNNVSKKGVGNIKNNKAQHIEGMR